MKTNLYQRVSEQLRQFESRDFGRGATEQEIRDAESQLGLKIAGDYREFLRDFGWGGVQHLELYGLGGDVPYHLDLVEITTSERSETEVRLQNHLIPIMNDGGGNLYCLNIGEDEEPKIVFWDHTGSSDQVLEIEGESFSAWLLDEIAELKRS